MDAELFLRLGIGLCMVAFGVHQIINPKYWVVYEPKWLKSLLPMKDTTSMRVHSFGNIALGVLMLLGLFPAFTYWASLIWWLTILPFAFYHQWDIGLRDLTIIFANIALILLRH